jgi:uncharacterized phage protein gp47/JayE
MNGGDYLSSKEISLPDFLKETEDEIHQRMLQGFPSDISTTEGSIAWDATRPVAIEKAEMISMQLTEVLRIALPQYSYGEHLRFLAVLRGIWEKEAVKARTMLRVEAAPGTSIPAGSIAIVPSDGVQEVIEFKTLERGDVDETEIIELQVESLKEGVEGNVDAGTIIAFARSITGVRSVTNPEPATGGADPEDDESLRERFIYSYQEPPLSGARNDYKRWAQEVPGVGFVDVIPEWEGPGTVKVILLDANGAPANQSLVDAVQEHIAPDGRDGGGLAPIGALVTVVGPAVKEINVSYDAVLEEGVDPAVFNNGFIQALQQYYTQVGVGGIVNYNKIGGILINLDGVKDYSDLLVNNATENIQLVSGEVAVSGVVVGGT